MTSNALRRTLSAVTLSLGFALLASSALAQALPSSVDPGRVRSDIDRDINPGTIATPQDVTTTPDVVAPKGAEKITLVLKKIDVVGASALSEDAVAPAYKHLIGKKITLTEVYAIANRITRIYRDKGYILSRAVVPQQEIDNGIVKIQVVEGFVSGFSIQGTTYGAKREIEAFANKLRDSGALTAANLERYLLLMNDLPGVKVRSVLSPSAATPGGADMTLVVEQDRFQGLAALDNYGNAYLGEERLTFGAQLNSLFQSSDQWNGTFLWAPDSDELRYYNASFRHNIGAEGTKVGANVSYTLTDPSLPDLLGGNLGPEGESSSVGFNLEHPFIRSRNLNVYGDAAFDITKNKTNYNPGLSAIETEDNQRVIRAGGRVTYLDGLAGYNSFNGKISQGLEVFGSSEEGDGNLSRGNGDPSFTKVALDATRLQRIYGPITGLLGLSGQYAFDPLLASEEFGVGGSDIGRGYDSSEITGDHGLAGKVELAYTNTIGKKYLNDYQVYTFYDLGAIWQDDRIASEDARQSLASTGVGTRLTFTDTLRGDAFIAKPLTNVSPSRGTEDQDDWRFKFSVTSNF